MIQRWSFDSLLSSWSGSSRRAALGVLAAGSLVACGGSRAPVNTAPVASAQQALKSFMRAVTDSNLTKMAELWGGSKGPAATTGQPTDYERRMVVIQSYLRHDDYRIAADGNDHGNRSIKVELRRQACTWIVPFTLSKLGEDQWIVSNIDLTQAGNPVRPCNPDAKAGSSADSTSKP